MFRFFIFFVFVVFSYVSFAQVCVGPSPVCPPIPGDEPVGPTELCLPWGCSPVTYVTVDTNFVVAISSLPTDAACGGGFGPAPSCSYKVMGWAGPCAGVMSTCPDIKNQAFADMQTNLLRINRSFRAAGLQQ
jgi:hypothetical protein